MLFIKRKVKSFKSFLDVTSISSWEYIVGKVGYPRRPSPWPHFPALAWASRGVPRPHGICSLPSIPPMGGAQEASWLDAHTSTSRSRSFGWLPRACEHRWGLEHRSMVNPKLCLAAQLPRHHVTAEERPKGLFIKTLLSPFNSDVAGLLCQDSVYKYLLPSS